MVPRAREADIGRATIYGGAALVVSLWVWTLGRSVLVLTDGVPTATDPLTPPGLILATAALVLVAWAALGLLDLACLGARQVLGAPREA